MQLRVPRGGADLAHFVKFSVPALTKEGLGPHDGESPELFFERVDVGGDGLVTRHDDDDYAEQEQPASEVREGAEETEAAPEDGCALLLATTCAHGCL